MLWTTSQLDAEELEALGIESLPDNLGPGGFTAVAYNAISTGLNGEKKVCRDCLQMTSGDHIALQPLQD
jgi:hypothetical protein